ncbi:hypothetical protein TNCT_398341 [Trichonephila clavata]|uniref:Uncharacterized protein n=1 Tax=Trichonephila clavata TaxID=2740835 RepID=A0A8X6GC70_TRICU|nr:hypothetical protein TNCT_398341 [Trichonephila clavata]
MNLHYSCVIQCLLTATQMATPSQPTNQEAPSNQQYSATFQAIFTIQHRTRRRINTRVPATLSTTYFTSRPQFFFVRCSDGSSTLLMSSSDGSTQQPPHKTILRQLV